MNNSIWNRISIPGYAQMQADAAAYNAKPADLEFQSLRDSDGMLKPQYQAQSSLNTGYLDQMREDHLRGPGEQSTWRMLQQDKINREAGNVQSNLQNRTQQALDQQAMRGGVGRGAAERIGQQGVQQSLNAQQQIFGQGLEADLQDEQLRQQGLANLGNAEIGAAQNQQQIQQFNIQNSLNDVTQERAFDSNKYNQDMQAWAARQTAAATPSSSGGKK